MFPKERGYRQGAISAGTAAERKARMQEYKELLGIERWADLFRGENLREFLGALTTAAMGVMLLFGIILIA